MMTEKKLVKRPSVPPAEDRNKWKKIERMGKKRHLIQIEINIILWKSEMKKKIRDFPHATDFYL